MKKNNAMSPMGYAIVLVIILGIVMIISAPMLINKVKDDKKSNDNYEEQQYQEEKYINVASELRRIEESLSSRINELENAMEENGSSSSEDISDKYICTIERNPSELGNLEPIEGGADPKKFVFVCEYVK